MAVNGPAANFERYFAGEPLSPELAALRRGDPEPPSPGIEAILEAFAPRQAPSGDDDRPLTRDEKVALKEAQQGGGVTTLTRLLKRSLRAKVQMAILDSENDPLGRSREIAEGWAYIATFRRLITEMEAMVNAAIADLDDEGTT